MKNFCITIDRLFGSGGRTMGKLLSDDLGVEYYDRDLSRLASEESGVDERLFVQIDENMKNKFFKITKSKMNVHDVLPPTDSRFLTEDNLIRLQCQTIKKLADQESCIIIGRLANHVLKNRENVIRVFIYSRPEKCVTNLMAKYGMDQEGAEKMFDDVSKNRASYYKYYTGGQEWTDFSGYDLVIDKTNLTPEQTVEVIKAYLAIKNKEEA